MANVLIISTIQNRVYVYMTCSSFASPQRHEHTTTPDESKQIIHIMNKLGTLEIGGSSQILKEVSIPPLLSFCPFSFLLQGSSSSTCVFMQRFMNLNMRLTFFLFSIFVFIVLFFCYLIFVLQPLLDTWKVSILLAPPFMSTFFFHVERVVLGFLSRSIGFEERIDEDYPKSQSDPRSL
jgi:hypothetical protein